MFSLEGAPDAARAVRRRRDLRRRRAATADARQIVALAPDRDAGQRAATTRSPTSSPSASTRSRAGAVTEQRFEAEVDGEDVALRNVLLTLPGDADATIVVRRRRATRPAAPGAASSAAATGILVELANALGVAGHEKTFVLASTSGGTAGARRGQRELLDALPERDTVEAVIVISQPGAGRARRRPTWSTSSTGSRARSVQLERTAELRGRDAGRRARRARPSAFTQLARLAIPSGLGDAGAADRRGLRRGRDLLGRRAPAARPPRTASSELSAETVDAFGRAVQSTVAAIDLRGRDLEHGPEHPRRARRQPRARLGAVAARAGADPAGRGRRRSTPAPRARARPRRSAVRGSPGRRRAACRSSAPCVVLYAARARRRRPATRRFRSIPASTSSGRARRSSLAAMLVAAASPAPALLRSLAGRPRRRRAPRPSAASARSASRRARRSGSPTRTWRCCCAAGRSRLAARRALGDGPPHRPRDRRHGARLRARCSPPLAAVCGRARPRRRRPVDVRDHGRRRPDRPRDRRCRCASSPARWSARSRVSGRRPPEAPAVGPLAEIERSVEAWTQVRLALLGSSRSRDARAPRGRLTARSRAQKGVETLKREIAVNQLRRRRRGGGRRDPQQAAPRQAGAGWRSLERSWSNRRSSRAPRRGPLSSDALRRSIDRPITVSAEAAGGDRVRGARRRARAASVTSSS